MWEALKPPGLVVLLALGCVPVTTADAETRVLVLDAGEPPGASLVEPAVEELSQIPGWSALGPDFVASFPLPAVAGADAPMAGLDALLQRAQSLYGEFDTAGAIAALDEASQGIGATVEGEHGPLLVRFHWLYAQIALVEGQTTICDAHLREILAIQPWWEPPVGYLTPEAEDGFAARQDSALESAAFLETSHLPDDVEVFVDGFEVPRGAPVPLSAGLHLVRAERRGYPTLRHWYAFETGRAIAAVGPTTPDWDEELRARVRTTLVDADARRCGSLVESLARHAHADIVVVVVPGPGYTVRAAAVVPGMDTWRLRPGDVPVEDLAERVAGSRGSGRASPTLIAEAGGAVRIVAPADRWMAASGGLAVELGGGVVLGDVFEVSGIFGLSVVGPTALETPAGATGEDLVQRGVSLRGGALCGPRIPLGQDAYLWVGGGGGVAHLALAHDGGDGTASDASGVGGYVQASVAAGISPASGITFGPSLSLVYAGVPLNAPVENGPPALVSSANGYTTIQMGLRFSYTR